MVFVDGFHYERRISYIHAFPRLLLEAHALIYETRSISGDHLTDAVSFIGLCAYPPGEYGMFEVYHVTLLQNIGIPNDVRIPVEFAKHSGWLIDKLNAHLMYISRIIWVVNVALLLYVRRRFFFLVFLRSHK